MSTNKLEMSLDDIIKANKNKGNSNRSFGKNKNRKNGANGAQRKSFSSKKGRGVQKRKNGTNTPKRQNKVQRNKPNSRNVRVNNNGNKNNNGKVNAVATKKLVQKLVKKALAQRNIRTVRNPAKSSIRKRGGVRLVKTPVVLSRLNNNSRVISRRSYAKPVPVRRQIQYNIPTVQYVSAAPIAMRQKFPRQNRLQTQQVIVQQRPRQNRIQPQQVIIQQRPRQRIQGGNNVFQLVPVQNQRNSVRAQINALRRQNVFSERVQGPRRQFKQNVQKIGYVQQRPQQRRRFQNKQRNSRQSRDVFFEPQNFLQRI